MDTGFGSQSLPSSRSLPGAAPISRRQPRTGAAVAELPCFGQRASGGGGPGANPQAAFQAAGAAPRPRGSELQWLQCCIRLRGGVVYLVHGWIGWKGGARMGRGGYGDCGEPQLPGASPSQRGNSRCRHPVHDSSEARPWLWWHHEPKVSGSLRGVL